MSSKYLLATPNSLQKRLTLVIENMTADYEKLRESYTKLLDLNVSVIAKMKQSENLAFCYDVLAEVHLEHYTRLKESFLLLRNKLKVVSVGVDEINGLRKAIEDYEKNPSFDDALKVIDPDFTML